MLSPFVVTLLTGMFRGIGEEEEDDYSGREGIEASQLARRHFWIRIESTRAAR